MTTADEKEEDEMMSAKQASIEVIEFLAKEALTVAHRLGSPKWAAKAEAYYDALFKLTGEPIYHAKAIEAWRLTRLED